MTATAAPPATLLDWYLKEQTTAMGGRLGLWQRRTLGLKFDGAHLGDHVLPAAGDEIASEKMWERDAAARTLVSGDLDRQIRGMTSIPTGPKPTPDFVAALKDGRDVAVEHSRICERTDMLIAKSLTAIQAEATAMAAQATLPPGSVLFAFQGAPDPREAEHAAREMIQAMTDTVTFLGTVREPFGPEYPSVHACGVHWTVEKRNAPAEAIVKPWLIQTDPQLVADEIFRVINKKAERHPSYLAHGQSVWLTVWVDVNFCPAASVLTRLERMNVQRGPFEKIIVGCSTRAMVYDVNGATYHQDF